MGKGKGRREKVRKGEGMEDVKLGSREGEGYINKHGTFL